MDVNELKFYLETKIRRLNKYQLANGMKLKFFDRLKLAINAFIITFQTNSKAYARNLILEYRKKDLHEINDMINTPFYELSESLLSYYQKDLSSLKDEVGKMVDICYAKKEEELTALH